MTAPKLQGIVPPLVTPLRTSRELDREALEGLVERLIAAGVGGIFVLGTTGEGPSLDYRLRFELVERAGELIGGRVPMLVGITDTALEEAVQLDHWARDCGATGVVAAPPYYFPVPQPNLLEYFRLLADRLALPLYLYNMPACTRSSIEMSSLRRLAEHPRVAGLKDSSGDLEYFREALSLREVRPDWAFLTGPEHLLAATVALGGDGGVNGGTNLFPQLFVQLYQAAREGLDPRVRELQACVETVGKIYEVGGEFAGVIQGLKAALARQGLCENVLAPPLRPLSELQEARVSELLEQMDHPILLSTI
jgi:2-dehydro-3-deoxy-D-pentonate aldolase